MGNRHDRDAKQRSRRYARMFSALLFGLLFFVTGVMGVSLRRDVLAPMPSASATDARWTGRPILSQVALGLGMMALGVYWSRRLHDPRLRGVRPQAANQARRRRTFGGRDRTPPRRAAAVSPRHKSRSATLGSTLAACRAGR